MPISSMHPSTTSGPTWMFTPSASRTSAAPERRLTARLPCFATYAPAPATTNAVVVEMLNVLTLSPPVPTTSTRSSTRGLIRCARSRITRANPAISSTVSPFIRRAVMNAAIWAGVASPSMITPSAACASASVRFCRSTTWRIGSFRSMRNSPRRGGVAVEALPRTTHGGPFRFDPHPRHPEEIPQNLFARQRQDGLGVKLNPLDAILAVAHGHHGAVLQLRAGFQNRRQRIPLDDQRVVARCLKRTGNAFEDGAAVVEDARDLPVHRGRTPPHHPAVGGADALVAPADAADGDARTQAPDHLQAHAGVIGRARARRDDDRRGRHLLQRLDVHRIIAVDEHIQSHPPVPQAGKA